VPGGGTAGALRRLFAELIAVDLEAAAAAEALARARHTIPNTLPTEGAIRAAFVELRAGAPARSGLEAWGEVQALVRRRGLDRPPSSEMLPDPIAWQCLRAIGWRTLCEARSDDPAPRARFVESYEHERDRRRSEAVTQTVPTARRMLERRAQELVAGVAGALGGRQP
jgi:hypothetical protein